MSANAGLGQKAANPKTAKVMVRSFDIKRASYPAYRPCPQLIFFSEHKIYNLTSAECAKGSQSRCSHGPVGRLTDMKSGADVDRPQAGGYSDETNSTIRRRMFSSGKRPIPP